MTNEDKCREAFEELYGDLAQRKQYLTWQVGWQAACNQLAKYYEAGKKYTGEVVEINNQLSEENARLREALEGVYRLNDSPSYEIAKQALEATNKE